MCSYSTEMASELGIANLKFTIGSLLACFVDRLSFLVGYLNLGDLLVDSFLVLVDRLLYLVTHCQQYPRRTGKDHQVQCKDRQVQCIAI